MTAQPTFWRFLTPLQKPHKKPLSSLLLVLAVSSCIYVKTTPVAHAGMFDSLLKILLPFYDANHDEHPNETNDDMDDVGQFIDDGTDEGYLPNNTNESMPATNMLDLDDVIFSDVLTAHDSTPMLGYPDLYALLSAEFGIDRGQVHTALTIYKAESFKTNATAVFERALALSIEYETPNQSLAFARAWQRQNPEHIPAWFYVAHLALKAGDYHEASDAIGMILDYDSHADLTGILTGIIPQSPDEQRSLFYALQMMDDDNSSLSVLRAGLLLQLGDYAPALAYANKALKSAPQNLSFITLKIDILKASGQEANMWAFIHQKLKEMPHIKELHLYQIRHEIDQGELGRAWELLQVANRQTHDPDVSLLTALVGLDIGKYSEARAILTPLLDNLAFKSRANYYIAISHERTGNMSVAKEYYERVQDYEHVLDARTKVVGFYLAKNDVDKAIATLIRLRDEFEIYTVDSYLWQAEILMRQGKKTEAQNLLTAANREYPDDDRLLFASFLLLENELDDDDKRFAIDKLLELDEFNLAYRLADIKLRLHHNPDDQSALSDAIAISQIGSDDPNYDPKLQLDALVVLGNHALLIGDYKMVLEYLETPYEVAPDLNAGIVLLRAYQGLGEHDKVYALLSDLQNRFAFGANNTGNETQEY